jgi:hypothetical protein
VSALYTLIYSTDLCVEAEGDPTKSTEVVLLVSTTFLPGVIDVVVVSLYEE